MKLPKKQAAVVRAALEEWRASGLLDEETGKRLLDDLTPLPFDWYRLGRYALWSALTCILIGVAALLGDELFLELISRLFVMTELGRSLFLILAAAGLFFWGVRRRRRAPQKRLTNEGLFFLGVLAIAGSLASLAAWLYAYGGEDIGFLNISSLFLLAAVIYGALGLLLDSRLIWVTLSAEPDVLLMDEPFGALDALTRLELQDETRALFNRRRMTVLMITHDVREALRMADRAVVLRGGSAAADHSLLMPFPRRFSDPAVGAAEEGLLAELLHH